VVSLFHPIPPVSRQRLNAVKLVVVLDGVVLIVGVFVGVVVGVKVGVLEGIVEQSVTAVTTPELLISTPQIVEALCNLQYLTNPSNGFDRGVCVV
jgi:ABC-type dipeptide/oligopeptide/nickel transport system permease subunit